VTRECAYCGSEVMEPPAFAGSVCPYVCLNSGARLLEKETLVDNFAIPDVKLD
jgi:hypothetical protein